MKGVLKKREAKAHRVEVREDEARAGKTKLKIKKGES